MRDLEFQVRELHGNIMREFMNNVCSDLDAGEVSSCIRDVLSRYGFNVLSMTLLSIDGDVVQDINFARYARVEAYHPSTNNVSHIFTFAIFKRGSKFNIVYLQSAIVIR